MQAFWFAALFGAAQMVLTAFLTRTASIGKKRFAGLFFLAKLVTYVAGAVLFVYKFMSDYMYVISGYAVGLPIAALVFLFYNVILKKGEDDA